MNQYGSVRRTRYLSNIFDKASTTHDDVSIHKHIADPPPTEPVQEGVSYTRDSWSHLVDGGTDVRVDVSSTSPVVMSFVGFLSGVLITWTWYRLTECRANSARRRIRTNKTQRYELSTTQETASQQLRQCEEAEKACATTSVDMIIGELSISSIQFPYPPNDDEDDDTDVSVCTWETDASFRGYLQSLDHATAILHGLVTAAKVKGSLPHPTNIRRCVARTLEKMMGDNTGSTANLVNDLVPFSGHKVATEPTPHSPFWYTDSDDGSEISNYVC